MYSLGIDLGTTFTAAAIAEGRKAELFHLGARATSIPTIVHLSTDGELTIGEVAERRGQADPSRAAREFKRRFGDPVPLMLGGTPYSAESLAAVVFDAVVKQVAERQAEPPFAVCVTHPASYGGYKLDLLQQSVRAAGLAGAVFLPEPIAAAIYYASQQRVEPGAVVAVYDLGGGTFDAAVLRKTETGFEQLGRAEGLERLGGIDFDQSVFAHVSASLGPQIDALAGEPSARATLLRLREDCREAKESLSSETVVAIPVILHAVTTEIRLTRAEFEAMIRPRLDDTLKALHRAVESTGLGYGDVDRILLVGGSSRIPLVAQMVGEATGRPVHVDAHPKHVIAMGGALFALEHSAGVTAAAVPPAAAATTPPNATTPLEDPVAGHQPAASPPQPPAQPPPGRPVSGGRPPRRVLLAAAAGLGTIAVAVAAFAAFTGGDDSDTPVAPITVVASPSPTAASTATSTQIAATATATSPPTVAPTATRTLPPSTPTPMPPSPTATKQATVATTATGTLAPNTARITGVTDVAGQYQVRFEVAGFIPSLSGQHLHFYFDSVPVSQAGVPGAGPWIVYAGASPFTGYSAASKPVAAQQVCVIVAKVDHTVISNTGNCFQLP